MHDPMLKGAFQLNLFTDKIDITRDLGWHRESENLTDVDLKYLALYLEENYGLAYEKRIDDVIKIVANENRYHPVRDYLSSLAWDGTERIRYALHHFLGWRFLLRRSKPEPCLWYHQLRTEGNGQRAYSVVP